MKFQFSRTAIAACTLAFCLAATCGLAQTGTLTVGVDKPGVKISPTLYGLMTEEINHSYDGGLYGELIQNRNLKDNPNLAVHWSVVQDSGGSGEIALDSSQPINSALTTCLKLTASSASRAARVGISNTGFWGIPVRPNTTYRASFYARANSGFSGPLSVDIESNDGKTVLARAQVSHITAEWARYDVILHTGAVTASETNQFVISMASPGTVSFNLVSLFPPTYHGRVNGNRIDLMQLLGDMKPAFLRLPGGNYLEGNTIAERFNWKDTLHNVSVRPGHRGPWGYMSSDGLGLLEYLEWSEDLHMQTVLAVFAGYALRGEHIGAGPLLAPFVQDALDEIEYATGDTSTHWGAVRAADGHPAPFVVNYVEIGNEDSFDRSRSYDGRFTQFYDAIKAKYPRLSIIATAPVQTRTPDVIDDHYYRSARDMENDAHHYDNYSRTGPKIFVGEWASTEGRPTPTLNAALGDAAWLTGMERNSDLVVISSYAPLMVNVNPGASQWGTNLIGYDALSSFGSPSYYVQKMFSLNRGDTVLPVTISLPAAPPRPVMVPQGGVGVGTWDTQAEYKDIKVVNGDTVLYEKDFANGDSDWQIGKGQWKVADGALQQTGTATDSRATTGNKDWTDYTYTLQARKTGGAEGFLVLFHVQDSDNYVWWNIGGWGDTRTAMERSYTGSKREIGRPSTFTVETGRWYKLRIEVKGPLIRCFIDDKLVSVARDAPSAPAEPLYATASSDAATGDVILKVVNTSPTAQSIQVDLQGAVSVAGTGRAWVLAGQPLDVNTVAEPRKVTPVEEPVPGTSKQFMHSFPAYSVTVLRVKAH